MSWIEAPALCESSRSQQLPAVSTGAPVLDSTEGPNSPPFAVRRGSPHPERESKGGLRLRPDARAFAQGSPGRRLEHRAERGIETGGEKTSAPAAHYERTRQRS